jgi:hypothetical protein
VSASRNKQNVVRQRNDRSWLKFNADYSVCSEHWYVPTYQATQCHDAEYLDMNMNYEYDGDDINDDFEHN